MKLGRLYDFNNFSTGNSNNFFHLLKIDDFL